MSIKSLESEFVQKKVWIHDPLLYLKITFIGLDHAMTKPSRGKKEISTRLASRLKQMPRLLKQAESNISIVPANCQRASLDMIRDGKRYLEESLKSFIEAIREHGGHSHNWINLYQNGVEALKGFEKVISSLSTVPDDKLGEICSFKKNIPFLPTLSLKEIYDFELEERSEILKKLEKIKNKIKPGKTWLELYYSYCTDELNRSDIYSLYRREMKNLRNFFENRGLNINDLSTPMTVMETPRYFLSYRGSASFHAALKANNDEKSFFYITTRCPGQYNKDQEKNLFRRFHREYKFLTAHESIPGHHYLDSVRRRLRNPIRRQIESPLFYEGWATYAESLLLSSDYLKRPEEKIVYYKRRLWRSTRCQIDAGLHSGNLNRDSAERLLMETGVLNKEAEKEISRYLLNPGYQICYSLGYQKIKKLKKKYYSRMGERKFHSVLLEGGEIPFHFIEKKMEQTKESSHDQLSDM
ncbi:MAG: DUF885 family protein [Deltaproteobacteria bacterium]|nr:DUF885 family protein [Deltaproteobacteria bacterium]